jgi:hypothetical protein
MGIDLERQVHGSEVNSPPRYLDSGSGGKLLRPENQPVLDNASGDGGVADFEARAAIGAVRNAMASAGIGAIATAQAAAVSDFKNAMYKLADTEVVIDDLWAENTDWDTWDKSFIEPGVGLHLVGNALTNTQTGPVATAALKAALTNNFIAVVTATIIADETVADSDVLIGIGPTLLPTFATGAEGRLLIGNSLGAKRIRNKNYGGTGIFGPDNAFASGERVRAAFLFANNGKTLALSYNGSAVLSAVNAYDDSAYTDIGFYCSIDANPNGWELALESIEFYPVTQIEKLQDYSVL